MKKLNNDLLMLRVWLYEKPIGTITQLAGDRHWFAFDDAYLNQHHRPTLSLSFKNKSGDIFSDSRPIQTRLPPFFSNVLPEGHLRQYLAAQRSIKTEREFFLLAALGLDLPGAVRVLPMDFDPLHPDHHTHPLTITDDTTSEPILRFSLAGVQLKFSAIAETTGGLTVPADGYGGAWIVKLPSLRFPHIPENEYTMLALAHAIGINVPAIRLMPVNDIQGLPPEAQQLDNNALIIERFDRTPDHQRIHMEDFAQVFGLFPEKKYERYSYANIAQALMAETPEEDVAEFFRRLIFSLLIGNGDMHLKNWSILYPDGIHPRLSPAYDFVSTIPYLANDSLALSFGGSKDLYALTKTHIRRFADTAHLSAQALYALAQETIDRTHDAWKTLPEKSLLPQGLKKTIGEHIINIGRSYASKGLS